MMQTRCISLAIMYFLFCVPALFADTKENFGYNCLLRLTDKTSDEKFVALTFDDGPSRSITPKILEILNRAGVKATFFVLGNNVKHSPDIVRLLDNSGHEIGNHSYSHPNLPRQSKSSVESELKRTNDELAKLNISPVWFRPPYGNSNATVKNSAANHDMHTVFWSLDSKDWKRLSPETLKRRILKQTQSGEVILLHDIHSNTLRALPGIIDGLKAMGYRFVTMSEWYEILKERSYPKQLLCNS